MSNTAKINDNPNVPLEAGTPTISELRRLCYRGLVNIQPDNTNSFILGFYVGVYLGMNKPLPPYVTINIECGRLDRLIDDGLGG